METQVPSPTEVVATYLTRPDLIGSLPCSDSCRETLKAFGKIRVQIGTAIDNVARLPASPAYEPWLMDHGNNRLGARGLATLVKHVGKRRAEDNQRRPEVVKAIRFLLKPGRRKAAIVRKAKKKILLAAWQESSVIETIFAEAGQDEFEFIRLLEPARDGNDIDFNRLNAMAVALKPFLVLVARAESERGFGSACVFSCRGRQTNWAVRVHLERFRRRFH